MQRIYWREQDPSGTSNPNSIYNLNSPLPCNLIESQGPRVEEDAAILAWPVFCLPQSGYDKSQWMNSKLGKEAKEENGRQMKRGKLVGKMD